MVLVMQLIIHRKNNCLPAGWHKASLWGVTKSCLTLYICFYWLSMPPPTPGSRWDFLSIRLPSRKWLTLGQPWADGQELWWKSRTGTAQSSDSAVTSAWRPSRIAYALCRPAQNWALWRIGNVCLRYKWWKRDLLVWKSILRKITCS